MSESGAQILENKRFVVSPESIGLIKDVKAVFLERQKQFPFLSGVGFYGSRVLGREKKASDIDIILFYNSQRASGFNQSGVFFNFAINLGHIPNETDIKTLDLNPAKIASDLASFKAEIDRRLISGESLNLGEYGPAKGIFSVFHLAVGDEVYITRKNILNSFRKMNEGDIYFAALMNNLFQWERSEKNPNRIPIYQNVPQTVSEAEKFFVTKNQRNLVPSNFRKAMRKAMIWLRKLK